jgi:IS5 family transposase
VFWRVSPAVSGICFEVMPLRLRNFRAGIEAGISCLKRAYGLARSTWRGLEHFKAYVWSSVVAYNLVLLARLKPV